MEKMMSMLTIRSPKEDENGAEHEYCIRCGRKLKNAESRKLGLGKVCEMKWKLQQTNRLFGQKQ